MGIRRWCKPTYFLVSIITIGSFIVWQNKCIMITNYTYSHNKLPDIFDNYKILHLSDLHNTCFGKNQKILINYTRKLNPDCIIITGDLIDCHRMDLEVAMNYINEATKLAPVYYISGNHEAWAGINETLNIKLRQVGVQVLDDEKVSLHHKGESIEIIGLTDKMVPDTEKQLQRLTKDVSEQFTLLLSHRPEYMPTYEKFPIELVLSGHAHGGQIRLPIVGGLYAPGQGVLPMYTSGLYESNGTSMLVNRGLGNSKFPIRFLNRPEMVLITLKK